MSLVTLSRCAQQTLKLLKLDFCVGAWFEQIIIMTCTDFSDYSEPLESANRTPCMKTSCCITASQRNQEEHFVKHYLLPFGSCINRY